MCTNSMYEEETKHKMKENLVGLLTMVKEDNTLVSVQQETVQHCLQNQLKNKQTHANTDVIFTKMFPVYHRNSFSKQQGTLWGLGG